MVIGTYEITKKAVIVAAENKTSAYGDALVELTGAIAGVTFAVVGNQNFMMLQFQCKN